MLLGVIPQHRKHTNTHQHTHVHTHTHTHAHTHPSFSPHSNSPPVRDLSSAPLDWHFKPDPVSSSVFSSTTVKKHWFCPTQSSRGWAQNVRAAPGGVSPTLPGSLRGSMAGAGAFWSACVPAEPRAAGLELRCLLSASPATRKAVYGDTQCEKGADLKRRRMQARTTKVSYSKVCASPLLSSTP